MILTGSARTGTLFYCPTILRKARNSPWEIVTVAGPGPTSLTSSPPNFPWSTPSAYPVTVILKLGAVYDTP